MVSSFFSRSRHGDDTTSSVPAADSQQVSEPGGFTRADLTRTLRGWQDELRDIIGRDRETGHILDLTDAHPSGVAQLFAGRPTLLATLIRDRREHSRAASTLRTILTEVADLRTRYGNATVCLAMGEARWNSDETTSSSPMLLRPVVISTDSSGELTLELTGVLSVAPDMREAMASVGRDLDEADLISEAASGRSFAPGHAQAALARELSGVIPGLTVHDRIAIGVFLHPAHALVRELGDIRLFADSTLVRAIAGDELARRHTDTADIAHNPSDRDPWHERGVGDQLPEELDQVEAVAAGRNLILDVTGDADASQVMASIAVDAAAEGKKVVVASSSRQHLARVWRAIDRAGLGDAAARIDDSDDAQAALVEALLAIYADDQPMADRDTIEMTRTQLRRVRESLASHTEAMHRPFPQWGVSAHDALQVLTELVSMRPGPRTKVRLSPDALARLAADHDDEAKTTLMSAAHAGMFTKSAEQDPWYGVVISSKEQVPSVLEHVERLATDLLQTMRIHMATTASITGLVPATTFASWEEQLRMLDGVREALDVFQPVIFERNVADMVIATASKQWRRDNGLEMKRSQRVRLTKQAKDMLRPGRYVDDLHEELRRVQRQRDVWRRHCDAGGWPKIPSNLDDMRAHAEEVRRQLDKLDPHTSTAYGNLADVDITTLSLTMERLHADPAGAQQLPDRIGTLKTLRHYGLDALLKDLKDRKVPVSLVEKELDLAWWASALGIMLATDPALGGFDPTAVQDLITQFRTLDRDHVTGLSALASDAIRRRRAQVRAHHFDADTQLGNAIEAGYLNRISPVTSFTTSELVRDLFPIHLASPVLIPQIIAPGERVDLLILDRVDVMELPQIIPLLARANQVVATADLRRESSAARALRSIAAVDQVAPAPVRVNEVAAQLLARYGVAEVAPAVPTARAARPLTIRYAEGQGTPRPQALEVESSAQEAEAVVDLVVEHALTSPEKSLAVATFSPVHARRLRDDIGRVVAQSPALSEFFAADAREPFVVLDPDSATGVQRDRVILSVGFAKTTHGRVIHSFGELSEPHGDQVMARVLSTARDELDVVSSVRASEFDHSRVNATGARMLLDLLATADGMHSTTDTTEWATTDTPPDQLLIDLADRLYSMGLHVVANLGVEGGMRIPLAIGHPQVPGELLVAILTDDDVYVTEPSLRRRDRRWSELLESFGWKTRTELAMAVFINPQREAEAIVEVVLDAVDERLAADPQLAAAAAASAPDESEHEGSEDDTLSGDGEDQPVESQSSNAQGEPTPDSDDTDEATETREHRALRVQADAAIHGDHVERLWKPVSDPGQRGPRPGIATGLPLAAYSDDQLDDLAYWVRSDGVKRSEDEMVEELHRALDLARRGAQVDAVLRNVIRRTEHGRRG